MWCKYCEKELNEDQFETHKTVKGVIYKRHKCKECYSKMKAERVYKIREWLVNYKKSQQCSKCGIADYRVLEFHHVSGEKEGTIGMKVNKGSWSIEKALKEIEKCIVVCANCHRIIHYDHRGLNVKERPQRRT